MRSRGSRILEHHALGRWGGASITLRRQNNPPICLLPLLAPHPCSLRLAPDLGHRSVGVVAEPPTPPPLGRGATQSRGNATHARDGYSLAGCLCDLRRAPAILLPGVLEPASRPGVRLELAEHCHCARAPCAVRLDSERREGEPLPLDLVRVAASLAALRLGRHGPSHHAAIVYIDMGCSGGVGQDDVDEEGSGARVPVVPNDIWLPLRGVGRVDSPVWQPAPHVDDVRLPGGQTNEARKTDKRSANVVVARERVCLTAHEVVVAEGVGEEGSVSAVRVLQLAAIAPRR